MREYLGDGVYAEEEKGMVKLSTKRRDGTDIIYLEPVVYEALVQFVKRVWGGS